MKDGTELFTQQASTQGRITPFDRIEIERQRRKMLDMRASNTRIPVACDNKFDCSPQATEFVFPAGIRDDQAGVRDTGNGGTSRNSSTGCESHWKNFLIESYAQDSGLILKEADGETSDVRPEIPSPPGEQVPRRPSVRELVYGQQANFTQATITENTEPPLSVARQIPLRASAVESSTVSLSCERNYTDQELHNVFSSSLAHQSTTLQLRALGSRKQTSSMVNSAEHMCTASSLREVKATSAQLLKSQLRYSADKDSSLCLDTKPSIESTRALLRQAISQSPEQSEIKELRKLFAQANLHLPMSHADTSTEFNAFLRDLIHVGAGIAFTLAIMAAILNL